MRIFDYDIENLWCSTQKYEHLIYLIQLPQTCFCSVMSEQRFCAYSKLTVKPYCYFRCPWTLWYFPTFSLKFLTPDFELAEIDLSASDQIFKYLDFLLFHFLLGGKLCRLSFVLDFCAIENKQWYKCNLQ